MTASKSPALQIAAIFPDRIDINAPPPGVTPLTPIRGSAIDYSPDGSTFLACAGATVDLYRSDSQEKIISLKGDEFVAFTAFSPSGKYISTYERPSKELGNSHRNLKVYDADTGNVVVTFQKSKSLSKEKWPAVQFTADESHLFHMISNAVNVHSTENSFGKAIRKVELKGVTNFSICPGKHTVVACYVPESKSSPAGAQLMDWSAGGNSLICRKSFFRVRFAWLFMSN